MLDEESARFFAYLDQWLASRPAVSMDELVRRAGRAQDILVLSVDLLEGFCRVGGLASPRIEAIIPDVVALFQRAHQVGVRHFVLLQDSHPANSPEFEQYGPHCVEGSPEAETVRELKELPFSGQFDVMPKRTLDPARGTRLEPWLQARGTPALTILCGNCTDICIYLTALYLKTRATALGQNAWVLVPANCVQTYEFTVEQALARGLTPHPGDLLHRIFLHHLALNGVEVVARVE